MTKNELKRIISEYPGKVTDLRRSIKDFMTDVQIPEKWSLFQTAYHVLYLDSFALVVCPVCSGPLKFRGLKQGYQKNCSASCRNRNPEFLKKYNSACMKRYGTEFASQSSVFRKVVKNTCCSKYGVDNPMKSEKVKKKHRSIMQETYGVSNGSQSKVVTAKIRASRIRSGSWVKDEDRSALEQYRLSVKKITARSYHDYFYQINPNNLKRSRYAYHLDHIYSVEEGFKNNVPTEIIGHYSNLRMLWHLENSKKNTKCHKTKEQLFEDYKRSTM